MPKVSIVVPTYNVEKYLKECMESIINQTLQDIEIICVNDGSTDSSGKILDEYATKDSRIKVIHQVNQGYGKAVNVGMDLAQGEYIGIVEPDDYVALDMYESLYKIAKEKDLDLIKADFHRFVGDGDKRTFYYEQLGQEEYYNIILNPQENLETFKFKMNTWAGIYKRDFIEKNNVRHNETPGASYQDNGFWFQTFAFAERIYILNKPLYKNRRDNPNSSINNKEKVFCMKEEYDFIEKILEENNLKERFKSVFYLRKWGNYIFNLNRIDNQYVKVWIEAMAKDFEKVFQNDNMILNEFKTLYLDIKRIVKNPHKWYRNKKKKKILKQKRLQWLKLKFLREINKKSNSQIVFWGASSFLKEFLEEYQISNENIIGIIDRNLNRKGGYYGGYEIYTPDKINNLNPNIILISVINLNKEDVKEIKDYIHQIYKKKVKIIEK